MAKISNRRPFFHFRRQKQHTNSYCGPAVLSMLLDFINVKVSQERIVKVARVQHKINEHGMNIKDLGRATARLAPEVEFWYKPQSTIRDIAKIVQRYRYPVGVEWLGEFGKYADGEDGHYSVVTKIDRRGKIIKLTDPYKAFARRDRIFQIRTFEKRWWDVNLVKTKTGSRRHMRDHHMLFVITRPTRRFPQILGMKKFEMK